MNAGIILTVPFLQNPAIMVVLLPTPAVNALLVNPLPLLPVEIPMIAPGTIMVPAQSHHPAPVIADTAPMPPSPFPATELTSNVQHIPSGKVPRLTAEN